MKQKEKLLNDFFAEEFLRYYDTKNIKVHKFNEEVYYVTSEDNNIISYMALNCLDIQDSDD